MGKENRGLSKCELKVDFFYHGTGSDYLERQIEKHGRYQHNNYGGGGPNAIFIGMFFESSLSYAHDRAIRYGDSKAAVLKIPSRGIIDRVYEHPIEHGTVIDFLKLDEYEVMYFDRDMERIRQLNLSL